jgi:hypothetical protein
VLPPELCEASGTGLGVGIEDRCRSIICPFDVANGSRDDSMSVSEGGAKRRGYRSDAEPNGRSFVAPLLDVRTPAESLS